MNATVKTVLIVLGVIVADKIVGMTSKVAKMVNPNAA